MTESIWDDPRITSYVLGEMSEQERRDFEMEIEANRELVSAVEEARALTDQLALLYGDEAIPSLDHARRAAIVAGGATSSSNAASPFDVGSSPWPHIGLVLAVAASLLVVLGVAPALYLERQNRQLTLESQADELAVPLASTERLQVLREESAPATSDEVLLRQSMVELKDERSGRAYPGQVPESTVVFEYLAERSDSSSTASAIVDAPRAEGLRAARGAASRRLAESQNGGGAAPAAQTGAVPERLEIVRESGRSVRIWDVSSGAAAEGEERVAAPGDELSRTPSESKRGRSNATNVEFRADTEGAARPAIVDSDQVVTSLEKKLAEYDTNSAMDGLASQDGGAVADRRSRRAALLPELRAQGGVGGALSLSQAPIAANPTSASAVGKNDVALNPSVASPLSTQLAVSEPLAAGFPVARPYSDASEFSVLKLSAGKKAENRFGRGGVDYGLPVDEGRGPGVAGDRFEPITDNAFQRVSEHPLSTFSVDVDTASYSKVRDFLMRANQLPRPDAVRIEELVNYFPYDYEPPADSADHPFAARASVTSCPWNEQNRLARIALKGKTIHSEDRPQCNLVFLLDTSGSMNASNKLPLVIEGMQMLLKQLNDDDKVAITVYAGSAGLVLDSTRAKKAKKIRNAMTQLSAGGSTNGGAGIALAYQTARENFIPEGVNRVILCTDGDFNVGTTGTDELVRMVENEAKDGVFLSVLGFGMGNHNDAMLEQISGRGNGNYAFIDNREEAHKVLVEQVSGTLVTIAKDVKLQIEFNPQRVSSYRLIGYENRVLAKEDFNDDKKDAGEIGAGHSVTALYEIVPNGVDNGAAVPKVDELKYQQPATPSDAADSNELLTLKLRYKEPDGDTSTLVEFPVVDEDDLFADADDDVRFAAAVASFGMQLRRSPYAGSWTMSDVMNVANRAKGEDREGLRGEFVTLVQKASELMGEE